MRWKFKRNQNKKLKKKSYSKTADIYSFQRKHLRRIKNIQWWNICPSCDRKIINVCNKICSSFAQIKWLSVRELSIFEYFSSWIHNWQVKVSRCRAHRVVHEWYCVAAGAVCIKTLILFNRIVSNKEISSNHLLRFAL